MRSTCLILPLSLMTLPAFSQAKKAVPEKVDTEKTTKVEWDGEWSLVADESDKLETAIEEHVKDQNFAMKLFWKKKLQNACMAWPNLDILTGESYTLTLGKEAPVTCPTDGSVTEWKRKDGEKFQVTLRLDGRRMTQVFQGDGYTLTCVFSQRKDGQTAALQATYAHPKLANPFSYKLVFRRNN